MADGTGLQRFAVPLHPMRRMLITHAKALVGTHPAGVERIAGRAMADLPLIADAWLLIEDGRIAALGSMSELPATIDPKGVTIIDASGCYVLPGWCDPHTHTVFAAPREEEFVDKIKGLSYQEIAARGGGILNSARSCAPWMRRNCSKARKRLEEMMHQGTVAVEIKSGYGLSLDSELKMLRVAKRLKASLPLQIKDHLAGGTRLAT
jgi:imidazolonepropionase